MFTVFVTGPLAGGKRTACEFLTSKGFFHIDLDDMAKELLEEDEVIAQLVDAYGEGILTCEGSIDRAQLAQRAFVNEETTAVLNNISWPRVKERLADIIVGNSCLSNHTNENLVVEIAMLAEAPDLPELADTTLCVTASPETRIQRALERGMALDDIKNRMRLQASDEQRNAICDAVIVNDGSLEDLYQKLEAWLISLQQEHMF